MERGEGGQEGASEVCISVKNVMERRGEWMRGVGGMDAERFRAGTGRW